MTLKEMEKKYIGKSTDIDGVAGIQCIDVAKMYLEYVLGIKTGAWGNACKWWENFSSVANLKNNFTKVVNTPTLVPKEGWIVIWRPTSGNEWYGHIAVCTGVGDVNTFQSIDQNYNGKAMKYVTHNYANLHGFLKPNDSLLPKITGEGDTKPTTADVKPTTSKVPTYTVGKNYTLAVNINVRSGAGTNYSQKKKSQLSVDGQKHALNQTMACLKEGTVITAQETKTIGNDVWVRCPSGWLAAYYNGKKYIK